MGNMTIATATMVIAAKASQNMMSAFHWEAQASRALAAPISKNNQVHERWRGVSN